jgi:hypothetical protein
MTLSALLLNMTRTAIAAGWGWLVAHVSVLAVVPEDVAVEWILTTVVMGLVAGALRWLETRQGDGILPRAARWIAGLLMFGTSARQPVYARPDAVVKVDGRQVQ